MLRHNAVQEKLNITPEGFVQIPEILEHRFVRGKFTLDDIKRVVDNNDKQRFYIRNNENGILEIRANQGHSISVIYNI